MKKSAHPHAKANRTNEMLPFIIVALALSGLFAALFMMQGVRDLALARENTIVRASFIREKIESAFNHELGAADELAFSVARKPAITAADLDSLMPLLLADRPALTSISAAPKAIVAWYYPRAAGKSLIGHDLLSNPERRLSVVDAIEKKTSIAAGPVEAVEGGYSVFNRHPVFVAEKGGERFWGIISVTVDFGQVLAAANVKDSMSGIQLALRSADPQNSGIKTTFWGRREILADNPVIQTVKLPGLKWELAVLPVGGWKGGNPLSYLSLIAGLISALSVFLLGFFQRRRGITTVVVPAEDAAFLALTAREIQNTLGLVPPLPEASGKDSLVAIQPDTLARIKRSLRILRRLSGDIRDFVSFGKESSAPESIEFDLHGVIADAVSLHADVAAARHIALYSSIESLVPARLFGDPGRLKLILDNLIGESVAFAESGEVSLSVILEDHVRNTAVLRFVVKDTGSHRETESIEGIFEPFNTVRGPGSNRYGTTGLALTLAYRLVGILGGRLECDSGRVDGFMFRFSLAFPLSAAPVAPAALTPEKASLPADITAEAVAEAPTAQTDSRILLVEDGEVNREIMIRMLKSRGYTADIATDGRQALAACLRKEYDLVFMDCIMPVMDGYESTSRIRELRGRGKPFIVGMNSSVMGSERERCFSSGMDDVIAKPFTLDELVATIKKHTAAD